MTLLLVNPNRETKPVPAMPVGLLRVAEAAEREGVPVEVLDLAFARSPVRLLRKTIAMIIEDLVLIPQMIRVLFKSGVPHGHRLLTT